MQTRHLQILAGMVAISSHSKIMWKDGRAYAIFPHGASSIDVDQSFYSKINFNKQLASQRR